MKRLMMIFLLAGLVSCGGKEEKGNKSATLVPDVPLPPTTVEWESVSHDFGEMPGGDEIRHKFRVKNTGANPLRIYQIKTGCSCTTGMFSFLPIPPGKSGFVELIFDPSGKSGLVQKTAQVLMNTEPPIQVLRFSMKLPD